MKVRNRLLAELGRDTLRELSADLHETPLPVGRVLYEAGDPVQDVYFPSSGIVSIVITMQDGRSVESQTVGHEGAVGLAQALANTVLAQRAVVQIAGSGWKIAASRLRDHALWIPEVTNLALRYTLMTEAELHQGAACNLLHGIEARLCRWLLTTQDRLDQEIIPLTQELLGMMLGVQRSSVTMAAQALKAKGLIEYRRGRISILDRAGLERTACECYRASQDIYAGVFSARPIDFEESAAAS